MKRAIINHLALVIIALLLSLLVFTRDGMRNVSPCEMTPGCVSSNNAIRGTFITTRQGFPVAYKQTQTFRPTQGANYKQTSLTDQSVSSTAIVLDVIFWFALLELLFRVRSAIRARYAPAAAPVDETATASGSSPPPSPAPRARTTPKS